MVKPAAITGKQSLLTEALNGVRGDGDMSFPTLETMGAEQIASLANALLQDAENTPGGKLELVTELLSHIRDEQQRKTDLVQEAAVDSLTGLFNRRMFDRFLKHEFARIARGDSKGLTFALIDLDGFKTINDKLGHAAGDAALKTLATALEQNLRDSDIPVRVGGDEFGVIASDTGTLGAHRLKARLVTLLNDLAFTWDRPQGDYPQEWKNTDIPGKISVPIRGSVGTAFARAQESADSLYKRADGAMYEEKQARKAGRMAAIIASGPSPAI